MLIRRLLLITVAVLMTATATTFMSGAKKSSGKASAVRSKGAAAAAPNPQATASKRLLRIFVHGPDIYPDVVQVPPGTVLLEAENQIAADITLVLQQVVEGQAPQLIATISAAQHENRARQTLTLSAGEYVFYEQSRPEVRGKLIVE
jgi:uncharacterized membrane protein